MPNSFGKTRTLKKKSIITLFPLARDTLCNILPSSLFYSYLKYKYVYYAFLFIEHI